MNEFELEEEEQQEEDRIGDVVSSDSDEWLFNGPLIFFHVVEMHYPIRVYR